MVHAAQYSEPVSYTARSNGNFRFDDSSSSRPILALGAWRCFTNERATQHLPAVLVGIANRWGAPAKDRLDHPERARWPYNGHLLR